MVQNIFRYLEQLDVTHDCYRQTNAPIAYHCEAKNNDHSQGLRDVFV